MSSGIATNLNTFNPTTGKSGGLNSINGPWIKIKLENQQHINYYKILSNENTLINKFDLYGSNTDQNYVIIESKDLLLQALYQNKINNVFYKNYVLHIKGIKPGTNNLVILKLFQVGYAKALTTVYNETLDIVGAEKMASNKDGRVLASCKLLEKNINIYKSTWTRIKVNCLGWTSSLLVCIYIPVDEPAILLYLEMVPVSGGGRRRTQTTCVIYL